MPVFAPSPGLRLAYSDRGEGPALVLVHGWSLSGAVFDGLAAALGGGRRLIAPDLRGHGASAPARYGLGELADDLVQLFVALDLRGAVLAGWSLGGQVALAAAPRLRDRLSGIALLSSTPRFTQGDDWPHGLPAQVVAALGHKVRRDPARALGRFYEGMFAAGELDAAGRALRAAVPLPCADAAQDGLDLLVAADLRPALAALDLPALVLHGDRDPICPAGAGAALAAGLPLARHVPLAGAGHAPCLSRPGAVASALASFCAGLA